MSQTIISYRGFNQIDVDAIDAFEAFQPRSPMARQQPPRMRELAIGQQSLYLYASMRLSQSLYVLPQNYGGTTVLQGIKGHLRVYVVWKMSRYRKPCIAASAIATFGRRIAFSDVCLPFGRCSCHIWNDFIEENRSEILICEIL